MSGEIGRDRMRIDTLEQIKDYEQEYSFILGLLGSGVPLEAINRNDYANTTKRKVFVTIPYGGKSGGSVKVCKRFSNRDLLSAVKFWFNGVSNV